MTNNYKITKDIYFINFISSKKTASDKTIKNYKEALTKFHNATNKTLEEIITNCRSQQSRVTEKIINTTTKDNEKIIEKEIIEFDVNSPDSYIKLYFDTLINYCKSENNKNTTINQTVILIRSFLNYYNITLPKFEKLPSDTKEWYPLTKEDIKFVMSDSTLTHASLISELKSTGERLGDALRKTIGDFMIATSEYHDFNEVDDFIDYAPQDMMATWQFYPEKTKKHKIPCITFSDPETCNIILQNLRKIKNESLPKINKEKSLNLKLTKEDALFPSQKNNYKGFISPQSITNRFAKKNKKLYKHHISLIEEKIKNGELSFEDKETEIRKIPVFHAHALRKFFQTTIAKNCGNLRLCALLEGHAPPMTNDSSYIKYEVSDVKEAYLLALEDLSLENTEAKIYTSEIRREMEDKINKLETELKEKEDMSNNLEDRLSKIEKLFSDVDEMTDEELLSIFSRRKKI